MFVDGCRAQLFVGVERSANKKESVFIRIEVLFGVEKCLYICFGVLFAIDYHNSMLMQTLGGAVRGQYRASVKIV